MFKSVQYIRYNKENHSYLYQIEDTDFLVLTDIIPVELFSSMAVAAVAVTYKKRNLSVVKNVALYYLYLKNKGRNILPLLEYATGHRYWLDRYYPELEYGNKYYRCVINQINTQLFISGSHDRIRLG